MALSISATVLIAAYLIYKAYAQWQSMESPPVLAFRVNYLILSFVPFSLAHVLVAFNWSLILTRFGVAANFRRHLKVYSYANALTHLPGGWWYVVGRVYGYGQDNTPKHFVVLATAIERALLLVAGLIVAIASIPLLPASIMDQSFFSPTNLWILGVFLALFLILLTPPVLNRVVNFFITKFTGPGVSISIQFTDLTWYLVNNLAVLALSGIVIWCLVNVTYPFEFSVQTLGLAASFALSLIVANLFFWAPVQFGIKDGVLALVLSVFIPVPVALATAVLVRICTIIGNVIWLVITTRM